MEHNKKVKCIRDGVTGECYDIIDGEARASVEELRARLEELRARLEELQTIISALTGADGGHLATDSDIQGLQNQITAIKEVLNTLDNTYATDEDIQAIQGNITEITNVLTEMIGDIENLESKDIAVGWSNGAGQDLHEIGAQSSFTLNKKYLLGTPTPNNLLFLYGGTLVNMDTETETVIRNGKLEIWKVDRYVAESGGVIGTLMFSGYKPSKIDTLLSELETKLTNLINSSGGSSSGAPENMVTTDTDQDITGYKTFYGGINNYGYYYLGGVQLAMEFNREMQIGDLNRTLSFWGEGNRPKWKDVGEIALLSDIPSSSGGSGSGVTSYTPTSAMDLCAYLYNNRERLLKLEIKMGYVSTALMTDVLRIDTNGSITVSRQQFEGGFDNRTYTFIPANRYDGAVELVGFKNNKNKIVMMIGQGWGQFHDLENMTTSFDSSAMTSEICIHHTSSWVSLDEISDKIDFAGTKIWTF